MVHSMIQPTNCNQTKGPTSCRSTRCFWRHLSKKMVLRPNGTPSKKQCHENQPKSAKSNAIKNGKNDNHQMVAIALIDRVPDHFSTSPRVPCVQQVCRGAQWSVPHHLVAVDQSHHPASAPWWRHKPIFQVQSCLRELEGGVEKAQLASFSNRAFSKWAILAIISLRSACILCILSHTTPCVVSASFFFIFA